MIESKWIDLLLYILLFLPVVLVLFDFLYRCLFLVVANLPIKEEKQKLCQEKDLKLLILVVARNEQSVIEQTLLQIKRQADSNDSFIVAVLADHCTDQTVQIATNLGVQIFSRIDGNPGKAEALSWFVHAGKELLSITDILTILDADTLIGDNYCEKICLAFQSNVQAVQSFIDPISKDGFPLTTLASYSEILAQRIDDAARSRLKWSVPLMGTGMAFETNLFCQICQGLGTQVDDIELSVRLAEMNIPVYFCPEAIIFDPKSDSMIGLAKQRGRWLKGQRQIWNEKWQSILKLFRSGLSRWSLIYGMLFKPKTALITIQLILIAIMLLWPFSGHINQWILVLAVSSFLVDLIYFLAGLRYVSNVKIYVAAFLGLPLLLVLWCISWGFSLLSGKRWLRVRKNQKY